MGFRWDVVPPDPANVCRRKRHWFDTAMRLDGNAAKDLASMLVSRHHSYCNSYKNTAQRKSTRLLIFGTRYNPCSRKNVPKINSHFQDAVGTCRLSGCRADNAVCAV